MPPNVIVNAWPLVAAAGFVIDTAPIVPVPVLPVPVAPVPAAGTGWLPSIGTDMNTLAPLSPCEIERVSAICTSRVPLSPRLAVVLSMIVHEIATNAAKYGALSNDGGTIDVAWEVLPDGAGPNLRLTWTESGGPPVTAPVHRGFGSRLIERSARDQLGGEATVDFLPRGVAYTITCALELTG